MLNILCHFGGQTMTRRKTSMRKTKEILKLKFKEKFNNRDIALACSVASSTVSRVLKRAEKVGIQAWPLPSEFDDEALLDKILYQNSKEKKQTQHPHWQDVHIQLSKKHVTLRLLWEEYKESHPDGYQYTQFCYQYNKWKKNTDVCFRKIYPPGEYLLLDYAGKTMPVINPDTGEIRQAQIFIAVLGTSNFSYVEATWTQEKIHWIASHIRAFQFFGGSPKVLVPDNLKSAITTSCRYDPDINPTYYDMASYYNCSVIPARPYKPRDKAKVESGVLIVERWILAALREQSFFSLIELNRAIKKLLEKLNSRPLQKLGISRRELFEKTDKLFLQNLPTLPYQMKEFKIARVQINYHVELFKHSYSVPYRFAGQEIEVRYNESIVEIFSKNKRIASHP